jgi:hypothetical protein
MAELKELSTGLSWRSLAVSAVAVVAASGIALLLIPQLSVRAAVRGGTIALGAMIVSRLILMVMARRSRRRD